MANYSYNSTVKKKPLTKEEIRLKQERRKRAERRKYLATLHSSALINMRERQRYLAGDYDDFDDAPQSYQNQPYQNQPIQSMDRGILSDFQNMKFCRKPVGFLMNIVFLLSIVIIAISFINLGMPALDKFTAMFMDGVPVEQEDVTGDEENSDNSQAENAGASDILTADAEENTDTDEENTEDGETEEIVDPNTYYKFSDPIFGWISYIGDQFNIELSFGDSPWYDAQIMKVQTGMADSFAAILIQAFPVAIILYLIFGLTLSIKTFICWASGDRRIYRNTWIECLIMIILALVVALGGFASTVEINGTLDFSGIVNFVMGGLTGVGGFTMGYGMLIMLALPLIGLILSFFLLEKKLRSRELTQPIIMYEYKDGPAQRRRGK